MKVRLSFRREWCGQSVLTNGKRPKAVFTPYRIAFVPTGKLFGIVWTETTQNWNKLFTP